MDLPIVVPNPPTVFTAVVNPPELAPCTVNWVPFPYIYVVATVALLGAAHIAIHRVVRMEVTFGLVVMILTPAPISTHNASDVAIYCVLQALPTAPLPPIYMSPGSPYILGLVLIS